MYTERESGPRPEGENEAGDGDEEQRHKLECVVWGSTLDGGRLMADG